MSRESRVKTTIDIFKVIIVVLMSALFGIFGFIVANLYSLSLAQLIFAAVGVMFLLLCFYCLIRFLIRLLDELEKL